MAEEDDILDGLDDAAALEEAMDVDGGGVSEEELDPLAEEMLRMMEDEGGDEEAPSGDVDQMLEMEMLKAMEEDGGGAAITAAAGAAPALPGNVDRLMDVSLTVTIELGRTKETIQTVMEYGDQSLIELDRTVGEPVDVLVNGELFARGEVVTVSENFGVRITELINPVPGVG